jgi:hypothetical protein
MNGEPTQHDELTQAVRKNIEENRKFLEKFMDEEFEPEDDQEIEELPEVVD